ncbi:MRG family protein, putative isoform 2 [Hibiscus syriacus]|uniref:MRG family protein, putative isoform 2 n=1 Tax=Hibiscus syriacus TaxID=106335 RepID=A0A6A2YTV2_HIBSY|nr:MRG family protein, putative isoform 2 [Hibiscus syriacus]
MGRSNTALTDSDSATDTKTHSDSDSTTETDEEFCNRYDTCLFREDEKVLAYHSHFIYLAKLFILPRTPNVEDILKTYLDYRYKKDNIMASSCMRISVHGMWGSTSAASLWFLQKNQNGLFLSTYHVVEDVETSTTKHDN